MTNAICTQCGTSQKIPNGEDHCFNCHLKNLPTVTCHLCGEQEYELTAVIEGDQTLCTNCYVSICPTCSQVDRDHWSVNEQGEDIYLCSHCGASENYGHPEDPDLLDAYIESFTDQFPDHLQ